MLRFILLTAVLLVPYAIIVDPPPPSGPPLPTFKSPHTMTLMTPFTWRLAIYVGSCSNDLTITASQNGRHSKGSQHYRKRALDFRTKHLTKKEQRQFADCSKAVLGDSYYVKLSSRPPHLHVALLAEPQ